MSKVNRGIGNILLCIAEIIVGILLLINPVGFTASIIMALGIVLAVMGIFSIVGTSAQIRKRPRNPAAL